LEVRSLLKGAKVIGVIDRSISFGSNGPLYQDIVRSLYGEKTSPLIVDFVAGLGGRDVRSGTIKAVLKKCEALRNGDDLDVSLTWADVNNERLTAWGLET
jgi:pyruvate/2-oxoacid:ferredoxin oxidoreductase alpha subunit